MTRGDRIRSLAGARRLGGNLPRLREALFELSRAVYKRDAQYAAVSRDLHAEYQALRMFLCHIDFALSPEHTLDQIASEIETSLPESVLEKVGTSEPATLAELRRRLASWLRGGMDAANAPEENWIG